MVEISNKSKEMIKETFDMYMEKEIDNYIIESKGRTIIHTYPTDDTQNDKDEELSGYKDALLFDVHIYNCEEKVVYKSKGHDNIFYRGLSSLSQKIFKDESTMTIIDEPVEILLCQGITVSKT